MPELTLEAISQLLDTKLAPLSHKVERIEVVLDTQGTRLDKVESDIKALGTSASSSSRATASGAPGAFVATSLEIKNFCDYDDRKSKGVDRKQAEDLVASLKSQLPPSIQSKVGEIVMYGRRGQKIKVEVEPPFALEISMFWKEIFMEDEQFNFNGRRLYTTVEREPKEQKRFAAGGRARAFLDGKAKNIESNAEAKCTWNPDWELRVGGTGGDVTVGFVAEDASISWSHEGLFRAFKCNIEQIKQELLGFQRQ
jgi:hypothetical protein